MTTTVRHQPTKEVTLTPATKLGIYRASRWWMVSHRLDANAAAVRKW